MTSPNTKAVVARLRDFVDNTEPEDSRIYLSHAEAATLIESLTAPVEGMETTEEERAEWLAAEPNYDGMKYFLEVSEQRRLLRDFDRLLSQLAAERARADRWQQGAQDDLAKLIEAKARAERMAEALREAKRCIDDTAAMPVDTAWIDAALTPKEPT